MNHPILRIFSGIFFSAVICTSLFLVHDILILRGREVNELRTWFYTDDEAYHFLWEPPRNQDLHYELTALSDGRYRFSLENLGFTPYYVRMYSYPGWRYRLTDAELIRYAQRLELKSVGGGAVAKADHGFDCGTGLGFTIIRPREKFSSVYSLADIHTLTKPVEYVFHLNDTTLIDVVTRKEIPLHIPTPRENARQLVCNVLPATDFRACFALRVMNYWNGEISDVYSNTIQLSREELLNCQ